MKENEAPRGYILTTPVKNEEENLPKLIQSVVKQTIRPVLWVIIDDGSTDSSSDIIREAKEKYDWIQSVRLNNTVRDVGLHLAEVINEGFEFAIEYCAKNKIDYNYLGNIDGDIYLEAAYFENLIKKFEENERLGIGSGGEWFFEGDLILYRKLRLPYGGAPLIRRKCFEDCDGISLSYAWDSVMNVKAKLSGWESAQFDDIKYFSPRVGCSTEGLWNGYKQRGKSDYFLGFNLLHAMVKGIKLPFFKKHWFPAGKKPYYIGIAYLYGYFGSLILRKKKIANKEIKNYYKYRKSQEATRYYFDMLKNTLRVKGKFWE